MKYYIHPHVIIVAFKTGIITAASHSETTKNTGSYDGEFGAKKSKLWDDNTDDNDDKYSSHQFYFY